MAPLIEKESYPPLHPFLVISDAGQNSVQKAVQKKSVTVFGGRDVDQLSHSHWPSHESDDVRSEVPPNVIIDQLENRGRCGQ